MRTRLVIGIGSLLVVGALIAGAWLAFGRADQVCVVSSSGNKLCDENGLAYCGLIHAWNGNHSARTEDACNELLRSVKGDEYADGVESIKECAAEEDLDASVACVERVSEALKDG